MSPDDGTPAQLLRPLEAERGVRHLLLAPVFNDFAAARLFAEHLERALPAALRAELLLVLVDDGSTDPAGFAPQAAGGIGLAVLRLRTNMGHQRAIAVALGLLSHWLAADAVVTVMDADGDDRPEDLPRLIEAVRARPDCIVVANRARRSESVGFRVGYRLYRLLYRVLTGHDIRHGNFSAMTGRLAARLAFAPSLWNHYAATIDKSRLPVLGLEVDRGLRFDGESRMNMVSLMVLGLSAISVHIEAVGVRMLVAFLLLSAVAVAGGIAVALIRLLTPLAIPGWASTLVGLSAVLAALGLASSVQLIFMVLAARERRPIIAAVDTARFVESVTLVRGRAR
ncbi:MAG TPA: glycosyltransferase [Candidatus Binatia bacterium]|nr:glycosyltransferase [Candidatus Binatia bacterium]